MRVLVVDDSRSVRIALRAVLEQKGYEVEEATNGAEAVRLAAECRPDLITLDVDMPEMNGFQACEEIRRSEAGHDVPIIFVTSNDTMEDRERGFALGASEFISKHMAAAFNEVASVVDSSLRHSAILREAGILMLVESPSVKMIVRSCLEPQGGQIMEAISAEEALDLAVVRGVDIDLVIIDNQLTEFSEGNLISALRNRAGLRHVPVIVLSEPGERSGVLELFRAGATDHIVKPFAKEEFLARVEVHLQARNLIKELNRNIGELERLSKLRDEFMAIASHDLKSPLNGITGFTQLLAMRQNLSEEDSSCLNNIQKSADFMLEIVNDIVELSRNETVAGDMLFEPVSVGGIASMAASGLEHTARAKGVDIQFVNNFSGMTVIEGNNNKLLRIMNNLISNAVKFTPEGGKVEVSQQPGSEEGMVEIRVRDTGLGIPEKMLPTLFDRFTKASRRGTAGEPGTGLGMSISKQLVDQHGGSIEVESKEGEGTCFTLAFPLLKTF